MSAAMPPSPNCKLRPGPTVFSELTIKGKADLQYSSFATLDFPDVSWFTAAKTVLLDGMTYQQLNIGAGGGKALLTEQKWKLDPQVFSG
jgi:hypothetical protein